MRIILVIFALLLSFPAMAEPHKPQIYDHNGAPVDPLCFLNNVGTEETPVYPTVRCEWEELASTGESPLSDEYVSTTYEENTYDPETDEVSSYGGFIGYRAIGQVQNDAGSFLALELIENGGGSGTFDTLMLLEMDKNEEGDTVFRQQEVITGGDRCMGGIKNASVVDGKLLITQHTTMADMLLLTGDPEREILKTPLYESLPFCAICCYALAHYENGEFTAFPLTKAAENQARRMMARPHPALKIWLI